MQYDAIIIGAGLSGLAAGIRLAHFEKKVLIVESHRVCGGLNSYYRRQGQEIDVGLHAMTNFATRGERGAPLTKLLRQLRLDYDDFAFAPQRESLISFPGRTLRFSNDFSLLNQEVATLFPLEIGNFERFSRFLDGFHDTALDAEESSARAQLHRFFRDPELVEMLLLPLMYYGNAAEDDMDFVQFATLWKSIYCSGLARPNPGMKHVLDLLLNRYSVAGGQLQLGVGVKELKVAGGEMKSVLLDNGEELHAKAVLSSAGYVETMRLCSDRPNDVLESEVGKISFVELIAFLNVPSSTLGLPNSITFFSDADVTIFREPESIVDPVNGVICCTDNFRYLEPPAKGCIRVTVRASYDAWYELVQSNPRRTTSGAVKYQKAKARVEQMLLDRVRQLAPDVCAHIQFTDLFTPLTIRRFSGHLRGTVYGSPVKHRDGTTEVVNLYVIGTDQGFLGIVGALLSGITIANEYCLKQ